MRTNSLAIGNTQTNLALYRSQGRRGEKGFVRQRISSVDQSGLYIVTSQTRVSVEHFSLVEAFAKLAQNQFYRMRFLESQPFPALHLDSVLSDHS